MTTNKVQTKQEEIREVIDAYTDDACLYPKKDCEHHCFGINSEYCVHDDGSYKCLMERLGELGVVIKGKCLGVSHPHLADYYTFEALVEEE